MVKVWAARGYDIVNDVNLVGKCKYTQAALERFGLERIDASVEEVAEALVDDLGRYYGKANTTP